MIGTLIFNSIAVFFAWLESNGKCKHGLKFSLFTIFIFLALRYDFGNDYMGYFEFFEDINSYKTLNLNLITVKGIEFGWIYLNRFFGLFGEHGFFLMVAFLAGVTCYILYRFIKKYVPPKYYWFAIFMYVFDPYYMLVLSSAMRQQVAGIIFLRATDFIVDNKPLKYIIAIIVASLFHSSAIILLILLVFCFINSPIKPKVSLITAFILFLLYVIPSSFFAPAEAVVIKYAHFYEGYLYEEKSLKLGLGWALTLFIYGVILFYIINDKSKLNNKLFYLGISAMIFSSLGMVVPLASRYSFYFLALGLVVYPIVFIKIKNPIFRLCVISSIIILTVYSFFGFFNTPVWVEKFYNYKTIFSYL